MKKTEIRAALRAAEASSRPFWGVGVGPETAAAAAAAGASWLVANHTAELRLPVPASVAGLMPFADANAEVLRIAPAMTAPVPVFAAAFAADPFYTHPRLLDALAEAGYGAVQNFPSIGMAEGKFLHFLLESDMGYDREVALLRLASERGMYTSALVFSADQAEAMLAAGADMLVVHPGFTADGEHRLWTPSAREMYAAAAAAARDSGSGALVVRSSYGEEDWPPRVPGDGVGVQYDGNYPDAAEALSSGDRS